MVVANRRDGGSDRHGGGRTVDFTEETISRMGWIRDGADHVFLGRNRLSDIAVTCVFDLTKRCAIKQNMGFKSKGLCYNIACGGGVAQLGERLLRM